jgi:hypothetical protein
VLATDLGKDGHARQFECRSCGFQIRHVQPLDLYASREFRSGRTATQLWLSALRSHEKEHPECQGHVVEVRA